MQRFTKNLTLRLPCHTIGTLVFAATMFTSSVLHAQSQTKSITPDPYFGSSQSSFSPVKKPAELFTGWTAPTNTGVASGSSTKGAATSNDGSLTKDSVNSNSTSTQTTASQFSGFGLSPQKLPTKNSAPPANQPIASTANAGFLQSTSSGSTSKPPKKSLIVHASQNQNAFGSGSGSKIQKVDHQEKTNAQPFHSGKVLALVGGEPIFVGDLMFQINQIIEERMAQAPEKIKEQQRQLAIPQLLPQFVESKLLYQGALQQLPDGVDMESIIAQVSEQFDENAMPKMMESAGVESVVEFDAHLRGQDYSLRQLKRNWAIQQFTRHSIGQAIGSIPETTHQEMLDRYEEKLASYENPARAKWEQILVRFDRSASRAEAKRTIVEIGNQIVYGANFAATAKKHSQGFNASKGGQHDWTTQGALASEEIDEVLFSIPVGRLSELIETKRGFHVIRVTERQEAYRTSFLDAQVDIKKEIEGEKRKAAFDKYTAKLRKEIPVEYLINE